MTSQGRLVVCGSILAGIAIIPAQAAKLVDIFIEANREQPGKMKRKQPPRTGIQSSNPLARTSANNPLAIDGGSTITDGNGPSGVVIDDSTESVEDRSSGTSSSIDINGNTEDTNRTCSQCGTSSHRIEAGFCWSCGSEL